MTNEARTGDKTMHGENREAFDDGGPYNGIDWQDTLRAAAKRLRLGVEGPRIADELDAIAEALPTPKAIRGDKGAEAPCEFCGGRGFTDDGHVEWDGQVVSAPEGCVECGGRGTVPAAPTQAAAKDTP